MTAKTLRVIDRTPYLIDPFEDSKYLQFSSVQIYKKDFLTTLKSKLEEDNISVVVDSVQQITDYTLILSKLNIKETIIDSILDDISSPDNGQTFSLHVCTISAETSIYNSKAVLLDDFAKTDYSIEDLRESPTFTDFLLALIFRHTKCCRCKVRNLAYNIFEYVAEGCAKSTANAVVNRIIKL